MLDRRKQQRWPAYLGGEVAFFRGFPAAECLVRNTSSNGARLFIHNSAFIPDEFDLLIPHRQAEYRVRARWRSFEEIGVEFTRTHSADAPMPVSVARRLKRLQRENQSLKHRLRDLND